MRTATSWFAPKATFRLAGTVSNLTPRETMEEVIRLQGYDPKDPFYANQMEKRTGELSEKDVLNAIAEVKKTFNIDESRTYLMGHSMGGGGTYYLASKYPEMFAAIGTMAPAAYFSKDRIQNFKHLPVMCFQGSDDTTLFGEDGAKRALAHTEEWIAEMRKLDMHVEYTETSDDHISIAEMTPKIVDFFTRLSNQETEDAERERNAQIEKHCDVLIEFLEETDDAK